MLHHRKMAYNAAVYSQIVGHIMTLQQFENALNISTTEAAALLGLVYPRYMEFRRGARELKPYHLASMKAHALLSKKALDDRLIDAKGS